MGAYFTHIRASDAWVDSVLQGGLLKTRSQSDDSSRFSTKGYSLASSLEGEYPLLNRGGWKFEPHARRKIHDVHVRTLSALTEEALKRIGELYAIKADIRGAPAEERVAKRQLKTKPLLKSMETWLHEKMKTLSRHSELAKALAYTLNQWSALTYYVEDGWAEADNNLAENALRIASLGRKTLCSSDHAGSLLVAKIHFARQLATVLISVIAREPSCCLIYDGRG